MLQNLDLYHYYRKEFIDVILNFSLIELNFSNYQSATEYIHIARMLYVDMKKSYEYAMILLYHGNIVFKQK